MLHPKLLENLIHYETKFHNSDPKYSIAYDELILHYQYETKPTVLFGLVLKKSKTINETKTFKYERDHITTDEGKGAWQTSTIFIEDCNQIASYIAGSWRKITEEQYMLIKKEYPEYLL